MKVGFRKSRHVAAGFMPGFKFQNIFGWILNAGIKPAATCLLLYIALGIGSPAPTERVVAIGDIHGDFDALVGILQRARLIDPRNRWSGGNAILVQTGDFLDRGPKA